MIQYISGSEINHHIFQIFFHIQLLRHDITDFLSRFQYNQVSFLLFSDICSGCRTRCFTAFRYIIHQIIDMKCIAAAENTRHRTHQILIADRSSGMRINLHAKPFGKFILRNQTNRKNQRIAFNSLFCSMNRAHLLIHPGNFHCFQPVMSKHPGNRMTQIQRNIIIIKALMNISAQTGWSRLYFIHTDHLSAFQGQTPCHDQSDIT